MAETPPAFLFYVDDFAAGTADMAPNSIGIYVRCLCHQWGKGFVPNDKAKVARLSGATIAEVETAWPELVEKFVEIEPGKLINERLESERQKLLAKRESRSEAGKRGAAARWGDGNANGEANGSAITAAKQSDDKHMTSRVGIGLVNGIEDGIEDKDGSTLAKEVADHYCTYHPRSKAGDKELSKIRERLKDGFTVDDLKLAIDGCHVSPWHCGQNNENRKYQNLELIMRDSSKVTQFIELAGQQGDPKLTARSSRSLSAIQSWLHKKNGALHAV
jgi:uncharacterized protein YdaU (DUF1376 family)